jgi:hypothetical protein
MKKNWLNFWSLKPWIGSGSGLDPDPDWIRIRIGIQPKRLDPDPDEMNADPQPWFGGRILIRTHRLWVLNTGRFRRYEYRT